MKLNLPSTFFALILLGLCVFLIARDEEPVRDENSQTPPGQSSRPSRTKHTPETAAQYFKTFATLDYNHAPTFAELEFRAKHLTDEQLYLFLEELDPTANFASWLRSALWAELGRRNDPGALELLIRQADDKEFSIDAREQAAFAYFRGRLESLGTFEDIRDQLIPHLNIFKDHKGTHGWRSRTTKALFKKLASLDPEAAWEIVKQTSSPEHSDTPKSLRFTFGDNQSPLIGFFQGLESHDLVQTYLTEWQPTVESAGYLQAYKKYREPSPNISRSFRIHKLPPSEETLISNTLASLARFDPKGALDWLLFHELDPQNPDYQRQTKMWQTHAQDFPSEAMQLLSNPAFSKHHFEIAATLGKHNLSLAPDLISALGQYSETQGRVLNRVISHAASNNTIDKFPEPDRHNRIFNFQERHDQMLEAIELSNLPPEKKEGFRQVVAKEFHGKLN